MNPEAAGAFAALHDRGLMLGLASNYDSRLLTVLAGHQTLAPVAGRVVVSAAVGASVGATVGGTVTAVVGGAVRAWVGGAVGGGVGCGVGVVTARTTIVPFMNVWMLQ